MRNRVHCVLAVLAFCQGLGGVALAEDDARAIIEKAFAAAKANDAAARQYVYRERMEERRFDRRGREKKRQSSTWDVTLLDDGEYRRLIARNDRPLDHRAEARAEKKLERETRKVAKESSRQRERRKARIARQEEDGERFLEEITRAFDFRLLREEEVDGLATWVISAEPKEGYRPRGRRAGALTKVRATLWVSRDDYGWVQADIETLDTISWLGVYRLREGAEVHFRQRRLADGVWVTERFQVRLRARLALVYRLDAEFIGTYSDFRRFTTDTETTGWSPID